MCTTHSVGRCSSNSETLACSAMHTSQHVPIPWAVDSAALETQRPRRQRLTLSVDHEVADMLAEDRQLEFARGVLQVSSTCQDRGDVVGLISWSRSRQLGASQSCRAVVGSRSVPLRRPWLWPRFAALRTSCRSFDPKPGRSHTFRWFCKILVGDKGVHGAGRHCDSVLQLLSKVPRVLLRYDEIWKVASEELLWVASLEDSVMRSLARRCRVLSR